MHERENVANWEKEYAPEGEGTYTSSDASKPSPALPNLIKYFQESGRSFTIKVLDIGAGVGRNALALAERGSEVHATEVSHNALIALTEMVHERQLSDKIHVHEHDMTAPFPFSPESFDLILDITSSLNILKYSKFREYLGRISKLCRRGGHIFQVIFDETDEYYQWVKAGPSPDKLLRDPNTRIPSHVYSDSEILDAADSSGILRLAKKNIANANNVIRGVAFKRHYQCYLWERS